MNNSLLTPQLQVFIRVFEYTEIVGLQLPHVCLTINVMVKCIKLELSYYSYFTKWLSIIEKFEFNIPIIV